MKKTFLIPVMILLLMGCSPEQEYEENEDSEEVLSPQDVKIPEVVFESDKKKSVVSEQEIKLSIKTYLDSFEDLLIAREPFEEIIYDEEELSEEELSKWKKINNLAEENDQNFANYIRNNTLPEEYKKNSMKISKFIITTNEVLYELDVMFEDYTDPNDNKVIPKMDIKSLISKGKNITGKKQKEIEDFLDEKDINTKAFGRE